MGEDADRPIICAARGGLMTEVSTCRAAFEELDCRESGKLVWLIVKLGVGTKLDCASALALGDGARFLPHELRRSESPEEDLEGKGNGNIAGCPVDARRVDVGLPVPSVSIDRPIYLSRIRSGKDADIGRALSA